MTTGGPGRELGACGERYARLGGGEEEWTVGRASSAVTREECDGGVSEVGWRRGGTRVMQYLRRKRLLLERLLISS